MSSRARLRFHVGAAAERAIRRGHPWVFAEAIRSVSREGDLGEIAALYDRRDRFLGLGLHDPASPLRVRMLHVGPPVAVDGDWWCARLEASIARRTGLFSDDTTGWRWIHGESDGWPGLVLDRYGDVLVLKLYTAAWLPRLREVTDLILHRLAPRSLILRLSRNIAALAATRFECRDGMRLHGPPVEAPVVFLENGLRFEAEVVRGQKTGFFLDQRENRAFAGGLAANGDVLNAFSFSGAFSVYAARGGARCVVDLDISRHALASAQRNFALNAALPGVRDARHERVQADVFEWLSSGAGRRSFDLVILDPPSMARRQSERAGALAAYSTLARLGAARVRPGGVLLAASCSAQVGAEDFFAAVRGAVPGGAAAWEEFRTAHHPPDHPAGFPEAHYLKAIYLRRRSSRGRG